MLGHIFKVTGLKIDNFNMILGFESGVTWS